MSRLRARSRTEYVLVNIFTGLTGFGINALIGFICRIVFVYVLSAEYLGIGGLFSNILAVLSLTELGISSAVVFALYQPVAEDDRTKIAILMSFYRKAYHIIGLVVAVIGIVIIPYLDLIAADASSIKENIYLLYLLYLASTVISYFFSYRAAIFNAMQRMYIVTGYNYVVTILQSLLQIAFLLVTHEYITYLIIQVVGTVVYNVWISHKAKKDYPFIEDRVDKSLSYSEKKTLFINVKALAMGKISGILVNSTDNIAISFFKGLASVGVASNYVMLSTMIDRVVVIVLNSFVGSVGNMNASASKDEKLRLFNALNMLNFWMYAWGAIGIATVSSSIISVFFGYEYVLDFKIPLVIAINTFSIGMLHACYTFKSTMGLFRYGQYLLFATGIINIVLDIVLGLRFGMLGVFFATLLARICTNLWYEPYAVFRYGLDISVVLYWKRYVWQIFVLMVSGGITLLICRAISFTPITDLIIRLIVCIVVPNVLFWLFFRKSSDYQYVIDHLGNTIKRIRERWS